LAGVGVCGQGLQHEGGQQADRHVRYLPDVIAADAETTSQDRAIESGNKLLWQFPLFRLDAETIWDSIFSAAQSLDTKANANRLRWPTRRVEVGTVYRRRQKRMRKRTTCQARVCRRDLRFIRAAA
jgi:hypothetical protein